MPVIRGGLNSNISDILEASGYGTETDIRVDDEYRFPNSTAIYIYITSNWFIINICILVYVHIYIFLCSY